MAWTLELDDFRMDSGLPENIQEAQRIARMVTVAIVGGSLSIVPMVPLFQTFGGSGETATLAYFVAIALGAMFIPWQRYQRSLTLIREFERQQAKAELEGTVAPARRKRVPLSAESHPERASVARGRV